MLRVKPENEQKTGTEAKRLLFVKKPESWVSSHKKGVLGPELAPGSRRRTEGGGDFATTSLDFTHYCGCRKPD